jgi:hypothetical protein
MLYEDSPTLRGLGAVVLDEVHYLADRERGAVWEEVIIQLAGDVQLACLSATVSNAEEFGAWLAVRPRPTAADDRCDVVITEYRPVPLEHHYAVNDRLHPVFKTLGGGGRKQTEAVRPRPGRRRRGCRTPRSSCSSGARACATACRSAGAGRPPTCACARRGAPTSSSSCAAASGCPPSTSCSRATAATTPSTSSSATGSRLTSGARGRAHPRGRRRAHRRPAGRGPRGPRLRRVGGRAGARRRRPPRRHGAGLQGDGRGAVRPRPGEGVLRDRDAGARHQHARAHRRHRAAREVGRRAPRPAHARAVHPADRPGRATGDRHASATPSCSTSATSTSRRSPRSSAGASSRCARASPLLQHGGQPAAPP